MMSAGAGWPAPAPAPAAMQGTRRPGLCWTRSTGTTLTTWTRGSSTPLNLFTMLDTKVKLVWTVNTVLGSIPPVVVLILHQCGKYGDKIIISSHCLLLPYCEVDTSNSPKSKVRYVIVKVLFCILLKVDTFTALSAMLNADHINKQQLCRKRDLQRRLHCLFVFCMCVFL